MRTYLSYNGALFDSAITSNGVIAVLFSEDSVLKVAISRDRGITWEKETLPGGYGANSICAGPDNEFYLASSIKMSGDTYNQIYFCKSNNQSFVNSTWERVTSIQSQPQSNPRIAVTPAGTVHIIWNSRTTASASYRVRHSYKKVGGAWTAWQEVAAPSTEQDQTDFRIVPLAGDMAMALIGEYVNSKRSVLSVHFNGSSWVKKGYPFGTSYSYRNMNLGRGLNGAAYATVVLEQNNRGDQLGIFAAKWDGSKWVTLAQVANTISTEYYGYMVGTPSITPDGVLRIIYTYYDHDDNYYWGYMAESYDDGQTWHMGATYYDDEYNGIAMSDFQPVDFYAYAYYSSAYKDVVAVTHDLRNFANYPKAANIQRNPVVKLADGTLVGAVVEIGADSTRLTRAIVYYDKEVGIWRRCDGDSVASMAGSNAMPPYLRYVRMDDGEYLAIAQRGNALVYKVEGTNRKKVVLKASAVYHFGGSTVDDPVPMWVDKVSGTKFRMTIAWTVGDWKLIQFEYDTTAGQLTTTQNSTVATNTNVYLRAIAACKLSDGVWLVPYNTTVYRMTRQGNNTYAYTSDGFDLPSTNNAYLTGDGNGGAYAGAIESVTYDFRFYRRTSNGVWSEVPVAPGLVSDLRRASFVMYVDKQGLVWIVYTPYNGQVLKRVMYDPASDTWGIPEVLVDTAPYLAQVLAMTSEPLDNKHYIVYYSPSYYGKIYTITLNSEPDSPTPVKISSGGYTLNRRPRFFFTVSDSDGDQITDVQVQVATDSGFANLVYDTKFSTYPNEYTGIPTASGGTFSWVPTQKDLLVGAQYIRCRVKDANGDWSTWSSPQAFTISAVPWSDTIPADATAFKAEWLNQVAAAANAARQFRGLPTVTFTDGVLLPQGTGSGTFTMKMGGSNPHTARARYSTIPTAEPPTVYDATFNSSDLTAISAADGATKASGIAVAGQYAQQIFCFNVLADLKQRGIIPASWTASDLRPYITAMKITWRGYGEGVNNGVLTYGANLYAYHAVNKTYNPSGNGWVINDTPSNYTSHSGTINPPGLYLGDDGYVYAKARTTYPSDGTTMAKIVTDYVALDVTLNMSSDMRAVHIAERQKAIQEVLEVVGLWTEICPDGDAEKGTARYKNTAHRTSVDKYDGTYCHALPIDTYWCGVYLVPSTGYTFYPGVLYRAAAMVKNPTDKAGRINLFSSDLGWGSGGLGFKPVPANMDWTLYEWHFTVPSIVTVTDLRIEEHHFDASSGEIYVDQLTLRPAWTHELNMLGTQGGGADMDWSRWTHYRARNYWQSETLYDDPVYGPVFSGQTADTGYIYKYWPFVFKEGVPYLFGVWVRVGAGETASGGVTATLRLIRHNTQTIIATVQKPINVTDSWQYIEFIMTPNQSAPGNGGVALHLGNTFRGKTVHFARPVLRPLVDRSGVHVSEMRDYLRLT